MSGFQFTPQQWPYGYRPSDPEWMAAWSGVARNASGASVAGDFAVFLDTTGVNIGPISFTLNGFGGFVTTVANIAGLRALSSTALFNPTTVTVDGYYSAADGGEGGFVYVATDTTTADNGGTVIVDASGRRWHRLTEGRITAAQFGCDMTGSTDSTTAFQAFLTYTTALNGTAYLGVGTIQISTITLNASSKNLTVVGAGKFATKITTNAATGNVMTFTLSEMRLQGFTMSSSVTRTTGSHILTTCNIEVLDDIGFDGFLVGISGQGNDGTWRDFVWTNPASGATGALINGYPVSLLIDNPTFYAGSNTPAAGIHLLNCTGGVIIRSPEIAGQGQNLLINPGTGQGVFSVQVFGGYLDSGTYGIAINPSGNGNVGRIKFIGVETNSNTVNGVLVENSGTGIVQGIEFIDHMSSLNTAGTGIAVGVSSGSSPVGVSIIGGTFAGNTNGISFGAGVTDFSIIGAQCGYYGGVGGNSAYGIIVAAGASTRYVIANCRLAGNTTASLSDGGSGTAKFVTGNSPYNPLAPNNIGVSASPFSYTNNTGGTVEALVFGGTVSAVEINGATVFTATNCAVTLPQGTVLTVVYSALPTVQIIGT